MRNLSKKETSVVAGGMRSFADPHLMPAPRPPEPLVPPGIREANELVLMLFEERQQARISLAALLNIPFYTGPTR